MGTRTPRLASVALAYVVAAAVSCSKPSAPPAPPPPPPPDPAASAASVSLGLAVDAAPALPGARRKVQWSVNGSAAGLELSVIAIPPGETGLARGNAYVLPGTRPASGPALHLDASGAWTGGSVALPAATGSADSPLLESEGEWRFLAMLRRADTKAVVALAARQVLVASRPAVRLRLNRLAATADDRIVATLETTAGATPVPVRILARLSRPDGHDLSLPGEAAGARTLFEGTSKDQSIVLLARPMGAGDRDTRAYRLSVRLLDDKWKPLAIAEAGFVVCAKPVGLSGVVSAADGKPLGAGARRSEVRAWDVAEGVPAGTTTVDAEGRYTLEVPAGHYVLVAEVEDAAGLHRAVSAPVTASCPGGADVPLVAALPVPVPQGLPSGELGSSGAGLAADGYSSDRLPKPRVQMQFINNTGPADEAANAFETFAAAVVQREPDIAFTTPASLAAMLGASAEQMQSGTDGQQTSETLERVVGQDFTLPFEESNVLKKKLTAGLVDVGSSQVVRRVEVIAGDKDAPVLATHVNQLIGLMTQPSLFAEIRGLQERPIDPRLALSVVPDRARAGDNIEIRATLRDVNGDPAAGKTLELRYRQPGLTTQQVAAVTGANGEFRYVVPAVADPNGVEQRGIVEARFVKESGAATPLLTRWFFVEPITDLALEPSSAIVRPGASVAVRMRYTRQGSPVPGAKVVLSASGGTAFPSGPIELDESGEEWATFIAGPDAGMGELSATVVEGGTASASVQFVVDAGVTVLLSAAPAAVQSPGTSALHGSVLMNGQGVAGIPVSITASAGTVANAATDQHGNFTRTWQPPADGAGTAVIVARATVDGRGYTGTARVAYSANGVPQAPQGIAGSYSGEATFTFDCQSCGSGTCFTDTPQSSTLSITAGDGTGVAGVWTYGAMTVQFTGNIVNDGAGFFGNDAQRVYSLGGDLDAQGVLRGSVWNNCHKYALVMTRQ